MLKREMVEANMAPISCCVTGIRSANRRIVLLPPIKVYLHDDQNTDYRSVLLLNGGGGIPSLPVSTWTETSRPFAQKHNGDIEGTKD